MAGGGGRAGGGGDDAGRGGSAPAGGTADDGRTQEASRQGSHCADCAECLDDCDGGGEGRSGGSRWLEPALGGGHVEQEEQLQEKEEVTPDEHVEKGKDRERQRHGLQAAGEGAAAAGEGVGKEEGGETDGLQKLEVRGADEMGGDEGEINGACADLSVVPMSENAEDEGVGRPDEEGQCEHGGDTQGEGASGQGGTRRVALPQVEEKEGKEHPAELRHGDADAEENRGGRHAMAIKEQEGGYEGEPVGRGIELVAVQQIGREKPEAEQGGYRQSEIAG